MTTARLTPLPDLGASRFAVDDGSMDSLKMRAGLMGND